MRKINKSMLDGLFAKKLVSAPEYENLLQQLTPNFNLKNWFAGILGILGAVLFLCGVVFFFAYNWNDMGKLLRVSLPLLGLFGCAGFAYYKGIGTAVGKVFGFATALFIGVFMAVYGQTYQTGAFVYELFFNWALLMLPLALILNNRWLWLMWMVVLNIYTAAYLDFEHAKMPFLILSGLNLLFFAAEEFCYHKKKIGPVFGLFIFLPLLAFMTGFGMIDVADGFYKDSFPYVWIAVAFALAAGFYGFKRRDIIMVGSCVLALDLMFTIKLWDWRGVFFSFFDHALSFLILYIASAYAVYLIYRKMEGVKDAN